VNVLLFLYIVVNDFDINN